MYLFMRILSHIIRQMYLPNPFINIFSNEGTAIIFNLIIGGTIFHILSYYLVGNVYEKGNDLPFVGSILYCISIFGLSWLYSIISKYINSFFLSFFIFFLFYITIISFLSKFKRN